MSYQSNKVSFNTIHICTTKVAHNSTKVAFSIFNDCLTRLGGGMDAFQFIMIMLGD